MEVSTPVNFECVGGKRFSASTTTRSAGRNGAAVCNQKKKPKTTKPKKRLAADLYYPSIIIAGSTQTLLCGANGYHLLKGALLAPIVETRVQQHPGWFLA